ncbi:MAG: VOC family protein [Solirubrobacteraceae bacterium]
MSRRDDYPAGVPCFVDTLTADVDAAKSFYGGIFGWEFAGPGPMPGDPHGEYFVARVGGDDVAGLGTIPGGSGGAVPAAWNTHVAVDSADDAVTRARAAGGTVLVEPFDAPPAGRMAVIADRAGAALTAWEAGDRAGAARVNEHSAWAMSLLTTPDPEGATAFYDELFGWQAEAFGPSIWLFRLPGYFGGEPSQPVPRDVVAAMTTADPDAGMPPAWSVDFWIADAEGAAAVAPGLGGRVIAEPFQDGNFRRAMLAAPDGAMFAVSQLLGY